MLTLWKSLILPRIDYCSQLYFPSTVGEMQELESLQRTFTNYITSIKHLDYWNRLRSLKLYSIERRFERYLIIYCWKILEDKIISPEHFDSTPIISRTGRKFILQSSQNHTPFYRAMKSFNSIPKEIRNIYNVSIITFKSHLDKFICKVPDEPNVPGYKKFRCSSTNMIHEQKNYMV